MEMHFTDLELQGHNINLQDTEKQARSKECKLDKY